MSYTQLNIFGEAKKKRIYFRDRLGKFASRKPSEIELLHRENNRLRHEVEMWRRKAQALAHYKIKLDRKNN